jgi:hypothetical protein
MKYVTDYRTGAVDRIPLTDPMDWNCRLHVVNSVGKPFPRDRMFWIVTADNEAHEVAYSPEHHLYTGRETYCRQDGESGSWEPDEILGWTDDQEDAEEAASLAAALDAKQEA